MNDFKELVVRLFHKDELTKEQIIARVVDEGLPVHVATQYVNEIHRRLFWEIPLDDLPNAVPENPPNALDPLLWSQTEETSSQPPHVESHQFSRPRLTETPKKTEGKKRKRGRGLLGLLNYRDKYKDLLK